MWSRFAPKGERRRHEHRQEGAAAVSRMLDRGETLTAIAELAGVKVSDVRAVLKSAGAQPVAPPDALGAPGAAPSAAPRRRGAWRATGGWSPRRAHLVSVRVFSVRACESRSRWRCGSIPRCTVPNAGGSTRTCEGPAVRTTAIFSPAQSARTGSGPTSTAGAAEFACGRYRYALAGWLTVPLGPDELGLHECDMPLCVKVCGMDRPRQDASVRSAVNRG